MQRAVDPLFSVYVEERDTPALKRKTHESRRSEQVRSCWARKSDRGQRPHFRNTCKDNEQFNGSGIPAWEHSPDPETFQIGSRIPSLAKLAGSQQGMSKILGEKTHRKDPPEGSLGKSPARIKDSPEFRGHFRAVLGPVLRLPSQHCHCGRHLGARHRVRAKCNQNATSYFVMSWLPAIRFLSFLA